MNKLLKGLYLFSKKTNNENYIILFFAIVLGGLFSFFLMGENLNPSNTEWLFNKPDPASHFIGWLYYSQDKWAWPITFSKSLAYPTGAVISYSDSIPIFAVIFKVLYTLNILHEKIQYFSILFCLNLILQFFWGTKLIRLFTKNDSDGFYIALASGTLFMMSPVMIWRLLGHFALTSHWLILVCLCSFFKAKKLIKIQDLSKLWMFQAFIILISSGIHPYLATMSLVLIIASFLQLFLQKKIRLSLLFFLVIGSSTLMFIGWFFFGYFHVKGGGDSQGYEIYSYNLFSIFIKNPDRPLKFIFSLALRPEQGLDSYSYLGIGIISFCLANIFRIIYKKPDFKESIALIYKNWLLLLVLICLTVYAVSNRVTWGESILFEYPLLPIVSDLAAKFRAGGRFFWPVYYGLILGIIIFSLKIWNRQQLRVLLSLVIVIQFLDLFPVYQYSKAWMKNTSQDPNNVEFNHLTELSKDYKNIMIFPSYQCGESPVHFPALEKMAVTHGLKTNSVYLARYSENDLKIHCKALLDNISSGKLEEDSIYIFGSSLFSVANRINQQVNGSHICGFQDGLIVCQNREKLSDSKKYSSLIWFSDPLEFTSENKNSTKYMTGDWSTPEPEGTWTDGKNTNLHLPIPNKNQNIENIYLKFMAEAFVNEKHPNQIIDIWVDQKFITQWKYSINQNNPTRIVKIPTNLVSQDGILNLTFRIQNPMSPSVLNISDDTRSLGIKLKTVEIYGQKVSSSQHEVAR
jgi:hypothetical protein